MLSFLYKYSGVIVLIAHKESMEFRKKFLELFEERLKSSTIHDIQKNDSTLMFKAPIARFIWNGWNIFNPISSGAIRISIEKYLPHLTYQFKYLEFFIISLVMSLASITAFYNNLILAGVLALIIIWGAYVISMLISIRRFGKYAEKLCNEVNEIKDSPLKEDFELVISEEDREFFEDIFFSENSVG